jgi:outer membrane protein TolC
MTKIKKLLSIFFATAMLISAAGCRTLTAPPSSDAAWIPAKKIKTSDSKDATWQAIRGQKIDNSRPLALGDLLDIALRTNPSTKQAWENAKSIQAAKLQMEGKYYPKMAINGAMTRQNTLANIDMADVNYLKYGPGIQLTYLLLDFGGRAADVEEQSQLLIAANFQFNRTMQDVVLGVETSYYNYHSARAMLTAAESDLKNTQAAYDAASRRYEVGLAAKLDMLQAKSTYEQALYSLENSKGAVKTARAALAKSLGYPADTGFEVLEPAKEIPKSINDEDITRMINDAIEQRPDIAALRANLRAQNAVASSANSDLYPSLSAGASANKNFYKYYSDKQPHNTDRTYAGYLSFDWDVFDGFTNLNKLREEQALANVEREKLIEAEIAASAEVWTKYFDFKTAIKKLGYSEAFLNTSLTSYELALESYSNGLNSILDLLDAESKLSDAKSSLIQSRRDLFVALAELAHATGTIYTGGEDKNE